MGGVCLKGRRSGGQLRAVTKWLGRTVKLGGGGSHWRLEKWGGGIGVVDVPSGRVVGGALGGEGGAPLPSSKALKPLSYGGGNPSSTLARGSRPNTIWGAGMSAALPAHKPRGDAPETKQGHETRRRHHGRCLDVVQK